MNELKICNFFNLFFVYFVVGMKREGQHCPTWEEVIGWMQEMVGFDVAIVGKTLKKQSLAFLWQAI